MIGNSWDLLYRGIKFQGTNFVFTQASVVLPYLIQGPRVLTGALTLGDFNQTATAFGQVHDALSFFRNAYDEFAAYRAVLNRLTGLLDADAESRAMPRVDLEEGPGLEVHDLTVRRPDAQLLIDDMNLSLGARRHPADQGPVRQRQDHPAAQPGRPLALRRRHRQPAARQRLAVPLPAALRAARPAAHRAGLPGAAGSDRRRAGPRDAAQGAARAPGRTSSTRTSTGRAGSPPASSNGWGSPGS